MQQSFQTNISSQRWRFKVSVFPFTKSRTKRKHTLEINTLISNRRTFCVAKGHNHHFAHNCIIDKVKQIICEIFQRKFQKFYINKSHMRLIKHVWLCDRDVILFYLTRWNSVCFKHWVIILWKMWYHNCNCVCIQLE